ncbi:hypothetical protein amrb99_98190 [Actinomadura sp. RB99]|nr:hypothetical protein [Actinomadura sp. RB99]
MSEDERERWINPGKKMTEEQADAIKMALVDQGPAAAAGMLRDVIGQYVPGMTIVEIDAIEFD